MEYNRVINGDSDEILKQFIKDKLTFDLIGQL